MSNLTVLERNGALVVDSRLIAEDLGVQHKNLLETLDKYLGHIEEAFGRVAFETEPIQTSGGKQFVKVAYLTEDQATLLMTFSRNTDRVVHCKVTLVKAFSEAKRFVKAGIQSTQPPLFPPTPQERLTLLNRTIECGATHLGWDSRDLLFWRDQLKNIAISLTQPALPAATGDAAQRIELPISDRAIQLGYRPNSDQLMAMGRAAAKLYRQTRGYAPVKREQFVAGTTRMVNVYTPDDISILDAAIQAVMGGVN